MSKWLGALVEMGKKYRATITQRYCHPQADAIERAFGKLAGGQLPALKEAQQNS